MRYGFVLDQDSCIGCHACTVACKAENDVVLGGFRTWVKWVEHGTFPEISRSAAILRCNHCADAPCIEICPTVALFKRENGIVDLDRDRCIGCASCLQACPYDAIHIDDRSGTASKCHFCAHRLEVNLAPACVSVCPEQAIKVIDLDEADTREELGRLGAAVRKPERQTRPQTYYLGADPAVLDPLATDGSRTLSHAQVPDPLPASGTAEARTVYDIPRKRHWGGKIAAYMVTKALASGALFAVGLSPWIDALNTQILGSLSLFFTLVTCALLISDLHQPKRFYFLLTKPNPRSWLVRGGWILSVHGVLSLFWISGLSSMVVAGASLPVALATSIYTAFLFRQARGRELWSEDSLLPWTLGLQTVAAASAIAWCLDFRPSWALLPVAGYLLVSLVSIVVPLPTPQAKQAHSLMIRHPLFALGILTATASILWPPLIVVAFGAIDWVFVKSGQQVALS